MSYEMHELTKNCPYCVEKIKNDAKKCKFCGEILDAELKIHREREKKRLQPKVQKWSPGVAVILSILIPGAGQMYKGNVLIGFLWLFFLLIGYILFVLPGLCLHLVCIISASIGDPYK